jgi:hypothetical protein
MENIQMYVHSQSNFIYIINLNHLHVAFRKYLENLVLPLQSIFG